MGRITSNVGLITGIPIIDTVDQLMQVAGAPRDLLLSRTQGLQQQQLAINTLSTRLLSLKFELDQLNISDPYESRTVLSQNDDVLTATLANNGKPAFGNYQVRPVQTATAQQLISQRFEDLDDIQSTGSFNFGFGGFVDKGISLDELNNGVGFERGEIQITDLAGNSAVIDLSLARSVDDVIETINANTEINVTASVANDRFKLSDTVGGVGTLSVQEVASGTTAASLGLSGISTSSSEATGADIFDLHLETKLSSLNDGNGVRISDDVDEPGDLEITLADETTAEVDLSGATTLGDVVDAINNHADLTGKITAAISSDGNRLELIDSTSGAGTFAVNDVNNENVNGSAATDLGLTETESSGVITGARLDSGLKGTLLSSLNGGQGIGPLGLIIIDDRSVAAPDIVDLDNAETIEDVLDLINASNQNVVARINETRNGIEVVDQTGDSGDFQILNSDATNSADALGIAVNAAQSSVESGSLGRQTLSEATLLSDLNGGQGITASDISITDSNGVKASIDLNASGSEAVTIGDVIDAINAENSIGVQASINDSGDGILLTDTALGSQTLGVVDVNGTLAADLNLTRASETVDINGQDTQVIDGTNSFSVDLSDIDGSSESISLSSLNGGAGIDSSDIKLADSAGGVTVLDLNGTDSGITSIGQIIDTINDRASAGANITASLNSSGTGILLTDNAGGTENLVVEDINGTAAADLRILSTENTTTTIDGIGLFTAQSASQGALNTVADRINDLESGVTASTFFDGVGYRLSLVLDQTGSANEILLDAGDSGFSFEETSQARDALLILGEQQTAGSGVLISSPTNDFGEVIDGVDLTALTTSDTPIDVTVASTDEDFVSAVEGFVSAYNSIRTEIDTLTDFNEEDLSTGLLFGTNEALRVDTELSRLLTDRYRGVGSFESLEEIGLSVDDSGKLQLDKAELKEAFADNPNGLRSFFTDENNGVVAKFDQAIDRLAGAENGLLGNRNDSLQATIDINQQRIDSFNESLDRQRERLLLQFFQLEQVIAGLQENQTALAGLQPLAPLVSTSS